MDLQKIWQEALGSDDELKRLLQKSPKDQSSLHPLAALRRNLLIGIVWAVLITVGYAVLIGWIDLWPVQLGLLFVSIFNVWIIYISWRLRERTPEGVQPWTSLRAALSAQLAAYRAWWQIQRRVSLLVYPVAITAGFILGGTLGGEMPFEAFLLQPRILTILALTLAVLTPLCYLGADWMFRYAYGRHLKRVEELLQELE